MTNPVLTEELIAELEHVASGKDGDDVEVHGIRVGLVRALLAERADLKQQLAAASVDADRYRWLRDESLSCEVTAPAIMVVDYAGNPVFRGNPWNSLLCDDDADAAIDAARSLAAD